MYINLLKALEAMDHNILIKETENMGWRGIVINLLRRYLKKLKTISKIWK